MNSSFKKVLAKHHRLSQKALEKHAKIKYWGKSLSVSSLRQTSAKLLTAGALSGALLLNAGGFNAPKLITEFVGQALAKNISGEELKNTFTQSVQSTIPQQPRSLSPEEEASLAILFKKYLNLSAVATLEGNHLNTTYGYTGEEQHLARYPSDNITQHDELQNIGMAPGLGAWGYFAPSKEALTNKEILMEKYYIAAQTLYLPDWNTNQPYLKNWYKYRKVLVVNPKNGQAAVAIIADSGPANWTGKQFGLSPELMHYVDLDKGMKKGEIIVFFVDDPGDSIPLGPIRYDTITARI